MTNYLVILGVAAFGALVVFPVLFARFVLWALGMGILAWFIVGIIQYGVR